uniref:Tick transposon n=1 Tax=Haemonchus placei TaxID=6290 RepID=A0A0N4X7T5_HAEPC
LTGINWFTPIVIIRTATCTVPSSKKDTFLVSHHYRGNKFKVKNAYRVECSFLYQHNGNESIPHADSSDHHIQSFHRRQLIDSNSTFYTGPFRLHRYAADFLLRGVGNVDVQ